MTFLDDGPTAGASDATGRATNTTGSANGIVGSGAGRTGAAGAKVTANATADIVSTADTGAALPADAEGAAAGSGTAYVAASTGEGRSGAPGSTGTSTATAAMVGTTKAGTARTTGTAIREDPDEAQERPTWIVLRSAQIIPFRIPSLRRNYRSGSRNKIGKSVHEDSVSKIP